MRKALEIITYYERRWLDEEENPLYSTEGLSFNDDVYEVVRLIPHGRVTAYGAIAKYLGDARASRRIGWALNSSFAVEPEVPAHRVVNRNGMLSGEMHFSRDAHG